MFDIYGIAYLGYTLFDEYKVMGLAPYGDPERLRAMFCSFYTLLANGEYDIHRDTLLAFYYDGQSLETISQHAEAPVGTIKRRLHVARQRLRQELAWVAGS